MKCRISERKISETLNHPQSTIHDVIFAYKNYGHETLPPRTGRLPIMIEKDVCHLTRILKENRKTNFQELYEEFVNFTSTNVCKNTLKKYLHKQDFYSRVGIRKPFVSEKNKQKELPEQEKEESE